MRKFEVGKDYKSECFNNSEMVETFKCVQRTDKTAIFSSDYETIKRKIIVIKNQECVKFDSGFSFLRA